MKHRTYIYVLFILFIYVLFIYLYSILMTEVAVHQGIFIRYNHLILALPLSLTQTLTVT